MTLIVCSLVAAPEVIAARRPSHVISLLSPDLMAGLDHGMPEANHLRLTVDDIAQAEPGLIAPDEAMVAGLLGFARGWDAQSPRVVHCLAGVSRSTAAALAIVCDRNPHMSERELAKMLRRRAPHAFPNRRIVALADHLLGRESPFARFKPFDLPSAYPNPAPRA
jgi:predicted protein tyrosine phosphatase